MTRVQGFFIALMVVSYGWQLDLIESRPAYLFAVALLVADLWLESARKDRKR